ncbi:hypothetical protein HRbin32_00520 [bacterium HR32]|nr:hypothetical protein HRbin32_00520 [bacterium HR32]
MLRPQRQQSRFLRGQRQLLVLGVGVQGLGAAQHRGQRLDRDPDHVVVGLEGLQARTRGLGVEPEGRRTGVLGAEALPHQPRPQATRRTELGHLLEQVEVRVEEETQGRREPIHGEAAGQDRLHVLHRVPEGERHLLHRGRPRLPDVVAGDGDGVPPRQVVRAELDDVRHQPQGGFRREDVGAPRHVLLQDVVLDGPVQAVPRHPLALGHAEQQSQQDGRRSVDGHGHRHAVQGDAVQQDLHVRQGAHRHPDLSDLRFRCGVVGVVAHLGGQVKGHAQPGLPLFQQEPVAPVGLLRGRVARVLSHGPQPATVQGRVDAPGVRELAREAQVAQVVELRGVLGGVQRLQRDTARRGEGRLALGASRPLPPQPRVPDAFEFAWVEHRLPSVCPRTGYAPPGLSITTRG